MEKVIYSVEVEGRVEAEVKEVTYASGAKSYATYAVRTMVPFNYRSLDHAKLRAMLIAWPDLRGYLCNEDCGFTEGLPEE